MNKTRWKWALRPSVLLEENIITLMSPWWLFNHYLWNDSVMLTHAEKLTTWFAVLHDFPLYISQVDQWSAWTSESESTWCSSLRRVVASLAIAPTTHIAFPSLNLFTTANITVVWINSCLLNCCHGAGCIYRCIFFLCVYLAKVHPSSNMPHRYLRDQTLIVSRLWANSPVDLCAVNSPTSCQDGFK